MLGKKIVFGFMNKVFEFFLEKQNLSKNVKFNNCILLHGGGWKKLNQNLWIQKNLNLS